MRNLSSKRLVVLDTCAVVALLSKEPGAEFVGNTLIDNDCYMHMINVCEVYYDAVRTRGKERADEFLSWLTDEAGVIVRDDMDTEIMVDAGLMKADLKRISLADCFCAALARRIGAAVLTADRREFEPASQAGYCSVIFIRE